MLWLRRLSGDFHRQQYNENGREKKKRSGNSLFSHHLVWNEAHIISNGKPPHGYTGDCSMWWLIAKLFPMLTPCWRVTKRDRMAYGRDLTLQMSLLSGFEQTVYGTFLLFFLLKGHEILLQGKNCLFRVESVVLEIHHLETCFFFFSSWLSRICERLYALLKEHYIYNLQYATLCLETEKGGVNPAHIPLRWSNSRHSTCHSSWQAVYLENSI